MNMVGWVIGYFQNIIILSYDGWIEKILKVES